MAQPTEQQIAAMTPMMKQYFQLKEKADGAILFFRMGDFYEIFGDDADTVAPVLNIVLTSRERGDKKRIPFCGVPHHSARGYWLKLLNLGFRIAIADQVEDPKEAKGLVKRDIVKTMSPGCVDDLEGLESDQHNYVCAAHEDPDSKVWALLIADISTGELRLGRADNLGELLELAAAFMPKELLLRSFHHAMAKPRMEAVFRDQPPLLSKLPEAILRDGSLQKDMVAGILGDDALNDETYKGIPACQALLAAFFSHLENMKLPTNVFRKLDPLKEAEVMALNETVIRDLELFVTVRRGELKGSLFREINQTKTAMGARMLRSALGNPLVKAERIQERLDAVEGLLSLKEHGLSELRQQLGQTGDLQRLMTRVLSLQATPQQLATVRASLSAAKTMADFIGKSIPSKRRIVKGISTMLGSHEAPLTLLMERLTTEPGSLGQGDQVLKEGFCKELDGYNKLAHNGKDEIAKYEDALRKETGISSLKIKNHKTFGLLIEVTKANAARVPDHFVRRQTMVNGERFVTDELLDLRETLEKAQESAVRLEHERFVDLLMALAEQREAILAVAEAVAQIDMLQGFAWQALQQRYCRPKIDLKGDVRLKHSRHPVVEAFVGSQAFVANDIELKPKENILLVTGPNMAGKSTVMRQLAIIAVMHQIGSYVPATAASLPIFDQVFTRVGAADDLSRGQSTFMVEMTEAAQILRQATKQSLVILDEVGRGTSTEDGLAIATAILEELAQNNGAYTMFATHFHELVDRAKDLPGVKPMQIAVIEEQGDVVFTHRLKAGASGSSYGIEVAQLAGIPKAVVTRARELLSQPSQAGASKTASALLPLESRFLQPQPASASLRQDRAVAELLQALEGFEVSAHTPLEALTFINKIKAIAARGEVEDSPEPRVN